MGRKEYMRKYRAENREKIRESSRRYYARHRDAVMARARQRRVDNADQSYAHSTLGTAISRGKLAKEPCLFCDDVNVDGHHHDYSLPLVVTWLCRKHHKMIHLED